MYRVIFGSCKIVDASEIVIGLDTHFILKFTSYILHFQLHLLKTERVTAPYLGQVRAGVHGDGGECEDGGDAQGHAVRGRLPVQPEPHPGQHHDQRAGEVHLDT